MKKGIDISTWQGTVDFNKVKKSGIDFLILRTGYGKTVDKKFAEYVKGANDAGIPILGVYHFSYALNENAAKEEADFCIKTLEGQGLGSDTLVFYDFEYDTVTYAKGKGTTLTSLECKKFTEAFCKRSSDLGYTTGVYSNLDYYRNWYKYDVGNYILWLAHYSASPAYNCTLHQYSSTGKVDGISGNVDMNYLYDDTLLGAHYTNTSEVKTIDELAEEVIKGYWGNGEDRKKKLLNAGYNYLDVQKAVNDLLLSVKPVVKTIDELANEVIQGLWGVGEDRKKRITEAGYSYDAVQSEVNRILGATIVNSSPSLNISIVANEVIRGLWGNGEERKKKLSEAGYDPEVIQKEVNRLMSI